MNKKDIKRLKLELNKHIAKATKNILKGDLEATNNSLTWIDAYSKLISTTLRINQIKRIMILATVCVLTIGLACTIRINQSHIIFEIDTDNVRLVISNDWIFDQDFYADEIIIDNIAEIRAPGLNIVKMFDVSKESTNLHLKGKKIFINELKIIKNADIEFNKNHEKLELFIKNSPLIGEISICNANMILHYGDSKYCKDIVSEIPETISFRAERMGAVPVRIIITGQEICNFHNVKAHTIDFFKEYPIDSGNFISSINFGKINILETGYTKELFETDYLILKKTNTRRLELSNTEKGIKVFFEGSISKIFAGPEGFEENLKPSILEYIYYQKPLAIFWGAVIFLFGILWRVRNLFYSYNP